MQEVFTSQLKEAVNDYYVLLTKGYPQKSVLKLVGDRFKLSGSQRSILYRGVCTKNESLARMAKLDKIPNPVVSLNIDGYNVLLTMANYLAGRPVFIGNDGLLRDSGEIHGKIRKSKMFARAVDIILQAINELKCIETHIYFDQPISHSANLAMDFNEHFTRLKIKGGATVVRYPDYHLKQLSTGTIASSDSVIVDKTPCRIFDMARYILEKHYLPDFICIADYIGK